MKTIITAISTLLLFCGCVKKSIPGDDAWQSKYLILWYVTPYQLSIPDATLSSERLTLIKFELDGEMIESKDSRYQALASRYGDTDYNGPISFSTYGPGAYMFFSEVIKSISVVSDADYDAEHPAGTPLDDIIYFDGSTPYYYIQNGYKAPPDMEADQKSRYTRIYKRLSEINDGDLILISVFGNFEFKALPTESNTHKLKFVFALESGDEVSTESVVTFQ